MLVASDLAAIIIVVVSTVFVVVVVLGLHIWGAIQDGREEKAMWGWRHRNRGLTVAVAPLTGVRGSVGWSRALGDSPDSDRARTTACGRCAGR